MCSDSDSNVQNIPTDAIENYCNGMTLNDFENLDQSKIDVLNVEIKNSKDFYQDLVNGYRVGNFINDRYKKKYFSNIQIEFKNGLSCQFESEVRIHGDLKDHIKINEKISSLDVKLLNGNILGFTHFKLFLPNTRNFDNEIFTATLLEEFGVISPKTFYVNVNFNGFHTAQFIFQEKVKKELIERYGFREGPIIETNENYLWQNTEDKYVRNISILDDWHLLYAGLLNQNWVQRSDSNYQIAYYAMGLYNRSLYSSDSSYLLNIDSEGFDNSYNYRYEAIMMALYANDNSNFINHATINHNRKFYYNPITNIFHPIYYDGMIRIYDNELLDPKNLNPRINQSIIDEAKKLFSEEFDEEIFYEKLILNGISSNKTQVREIIKKFKTNLETIVNSDFNQKKYEANEIENISKANIKKNLYFTLNNEVIDCSIINKCDSLNENPKNILLENNKKNSWIYLGDYTSFFNNEIKQDSFIDIDDFRIQLINNSKVKLDVNNKIMNFYINNLNERVIVFGKNTIKDWTFISNIDEKLIEFSKDDKNFLTGCLTFYDAEVENVDIKIENSPCEDAVNFINVNGSVNSIKVYNSLSDAVDFDFSNLNIDNINIEKAENDCLDLSFGNYNFSNVNLSDCNDKGLSVGEKSTVKINQLNVDRSTYGLAVKDLSDVKIERFNTANITNCIAMYRKKEEFGPSNLNIEVTNCNKNIYIQEGSKLNFTNE